MTWDVLSLAVGSWGYYGVILLITGFAALCVWSAWD